jgi:UDP-2,3-diacylglucosamine pyrophosphatase LpxH
LEIVVFVPDTHHPWGDMKTWGIFLSVLEDMEKLHGINEIVILGDFADFNGIKFFDLMPQEMSLKETMKDELYFVCKRLEELRSRHPDAKITYIEGNHESRLARFYVKNAPKMYDLMPNLSDMLQFEKYKIDWVKYDSDQLYRIGKTNLMARHEPYATGKNFTIPTLDEAKDHSLICGHLHRRQSSTLRTPLGNELVCLCPGWFGDPLAPIYKFRKKPMNWTQSFPIGYIFNKTSYIIHEVPIVHHRAVYNGVLYTE